MGRLALSSLVVGVVVSSLGASAASPAQYAPPPLTVVGVQPSDGGPVYLERVSAPSEGAGERWLLNLDVTFQNTGSRTVRLDRVELSYPNSTGGVHVQDFNALNKSSWVGGGASATFRATDARLVPLPAPGGVVARYWFVGYDSPVVVGRPLTVWRSKVPGGAYLFPGAREDLPDGWYWADADTHIRGGHRNTPTQRFAYDFSIRRWDTATKSWTVFREGTDGKANEDYLIWDMPIRAMADGWVIRCVADVEDNSAPGVTGSAGGNGFWIQHTTGEVALYAHMRKGTVKRKLCPRSGVDFATNGIKVKAGQELGRVGNSGQSTGPHLHVHLGTADGSSGQGRPLHFRNIRTLVAGAAWKGSAPCGAKTEPFATTKDAAAGPFHLVEPFYRPGQRELARLGVEDRCFGDTVAAFAAAGYKPVLIDGFDHRGTTYLGGVFRPADVPWEARIGLVRNAFQSELEAVVAAGYVPTHVETYLEGGGARYAFVAEKRPKSGYVVYHGRSAAQHKVDFAKAKAAGLRPVVIAVASVKGKLYYTGLWDRRPLGTWATDSTLTEAEYQRWAEQHAAAKRKLVYVNAYRHNGKPMLSAIVASSVSPVYQAQHGMSDEAFQAASAKWWKAGRRYQAVAGYSDGGKRRWAAIWR